MKSVLKDVVARHPRHQQRRRREPAGLRTRAARWPPSRGCDVKIAVVLGDDVLPLLPQLREPKARDCKAAPPLPARC
jgi:hypothetical protein